MNLSKTYDPNQFEPNIYAMWETSGAFNPTGKGEPYSIVMPPPNANGNLHIGHALDMNLKDILARYHRMQGRDVIYIPGADHAGFETWVVYERELIKQGKSRFDFTRDELYEQVWDFVANARGNMDLQLRALGTSASWDNLVFTLDQKVIDTVYGTFKKMWDEKLVYRGERIVSYCTVHQTSFADIEVNHKNEKGTLWSIAYPTSDGKGEIIVATGRPETMLGDVAIAVHPDDKRYKKYVGSTVTLPLTDREIPIVADDYVDPEFGTGAVKVTPAHDPNDFEIGERHKLPRLTVIGHDGKMIDVPEKYEGLDIESARKQILEDLKDLDLLRGDEPLEHAVGHCYKCDSVIQPLLMDQWFIKVQPLAKKAIKAIKDGDVTFTPDTKGKELISYYKQLRDWNISRQPAWGIPIPAFQNVDDPNDWIFDTRVDQPTIDVNGTTYKREEDTFDTWFSSGQWPYIVTDYLTDGELKRFYPTSVLETGNDLVRPWISRMLMFGLYRTDMVPFKHVYFHGMVLDEKGQKMSKSKGNVINPMEMLAEYGSDALRLGIIASRSANQSQAFSTGKVVAGRNFCNKLWNIARFIEGKLDEDFKLSDPQPESLADHWIVRQLTDAAATIGDQVEKYRFAEASEAMYHAVWDDVADWYVEANKKQDNLQMLAWVLDTSLRLAHPFAPFVTETVWQTLGWHKELLISSAWPEALKYDDIAAEEFERLKAVVTEARYVTAALPGNDKYALLYQNDSLIADNPELITHLARVKGVENVDQARGIRLAASGREAWLDVDADTLYEHQTNLEVRLNSARDQVKMLAGRLSNANYTEKAPAHLVEETRKQLEEKQLLVEQLARELDVLS
jgi:valyl-tRNA synthetase